MLHEWILFKKDDNAYIYAFSSPCEDFISLIFRKICNDRREYADHVTVYLGGYVIENLQKIKEYNAPFAKSGFVYFPADGKSILGLHKDKDGNIVALERAIVLKNSMVE